MSGFNLPSEELRSQWASLQSEWSQTRAQWNDSVAERFEREYWQELSSALPNAIKALQNIELALHQAERDLDI